MDPSQSKGKRVLVDDAVASDRPGLPAFLARPKGAPVYHGFPILDESLTEGWRMGVISAFEDDPEGCDWGDAFVEAPDGTRAGLVWEVGDFKPYEVCPPCAERWGVYGVAFPSRVRSLKELLEGFRAVLPDLKEIHLRLQCNPGMQEK